MIESGAWYLLGMSMSCEPYLASSLLRNVNDRTQTLFTRHQSEPKKLSKAHGKVYTSSETCQLYVR